MAGFAEVAATSIMWRAVSAEMLPFAVGGMTASRALGVLVGPVIGAVLYEALGFSAPFLVTALVILLVACVTTLLQPPPELAATDASEGFLSHWDLLRVRGTLATALAIFQIFTNVAAIEPVSLCTGLP